MIDILKAGRDFELQQEEFRHLERTLDLPKDSIQFPYEKELVLSGVSITEAKETHKKLMELASQTPFNYETVLAVHREVKDVTVIGSILDYASSACLRSIYNC